MLPGGEVDTIIDRQRVALTLSCDDRILDGVDGARFPHDVEALLEEPLRLVLQPLLGFGRRFDRNEGMPAAWEDDEASSPVRIVLFTSEHGRSPTLGS